MKKFQDAEFMKFHKQANKNAKRRMKILEDQKNILGRMAAAYDEIYRLETEFAKWCEVNDI